MPACACTPRSPARSRPTSTSPSRAAATRPVLRLVRRASPPTRRTTSASAPASSTAALLSAFPTSYATGIVDPVPATPETWTTSERHVYRFVVTLANDDDAPGPVADRRLHVGGAQPVRRHLTAFVVWACIGAVRRRAARRHGAVRPRRAQLHRHVRQHGAAHPHRRRRRRGEDRPARDAQRRHRDLPGPGRRRAA